MAVTVAEALHGRASSLVLAKDRLLPVTVALAAVLPFAGLERGSTVVVDAHETCGATSLTLEMLAGPSIAGYWGAVAGCPELGLAAAAERGIDLARLLLVPSLGPQDRWAQVVASLFDAVDTVLYVPPPSVRPSDARRLAARARDRGAVQLVLDRDRRWPGPSDLRCTVTESQWTGLSRGHGLLSERHFEVEVSGRGAAARPRRSPLQLSA